MTIEESGLTFTFSDEMTVIKFDETGYYRKKYNNQPYGKGVDIIADSDNMFQLIEIKNCTGHEAENMWRTSRNNSKKSSAPDELDVEDRDSLDIELAKKVASTISCLYGAWTKAPQSEAAKELMPFWSKACGKRIQSFAKPVMVILFLEGNFDSETRSKKMIMERLQDSASKKLSWLNCRVSVVDSATYNTKCFSVS